MGAGEVYEGVYIGVEEECGVEKTEGVGMGIFVVDLSSCEKSSE